MSTQPTVTQALLYVDLLGVRSRWHRGGRAAAESAFAHLAKLAAKCFAPFSKDIVGGGIESDSIALICTDSVVAVKLGCELYSCAFKGMTDDAEKRAWLRGAIVPCNNGETLRIRATMAPPLGQIDRYQYQGALLDAISVERSGIKGMRLLIDDTLVTETVKKAFAQFRGGNKYGLFSRLESSGYPGRVQTGYSDVLWMIREVTSGPWEKVSLAMANRLRLAAADPEEFVQAAATQLLVHECNAILANLAARTRPGTTRRRSQ